MGVLKIALLGGVHVTHASGSAESKVSHSVQALLAFLLLHRHRSHSRDALAGLFWGEHPQDRARGCLSTTLWRLRAVLEPTGVARGTYLAITPIGEVRFNQASEYWLDVAVFEEQVGRVLALPSAIVTATDVHALQAAVQLYAGELLEGFYDDWALRERERLRTLYLHSLQRLMEYYQQQGTYAASLAAGQLILQYEPLREDIHRALMRLHEEHGQRARAARQYAACRELLAVELGTSPLEETQTLYAQIIAVADSHHDMVEGGESANLQQALQQFRQSLEGFGVAREHLQRAIQTVERLAQDK